MSPDSRSEEKDKMTFLSSVSIFRSKDRLLLPSQPQEMQASAFQADSRSQEKYPYSGSSSCLRTLFPPVTISISWEIQFHIPVRQPIHSNASVQIMHGTESPHSFLRANILSRFSDILYPVLLRILKKIILPILLFSTTFWTCSFSFYFWQRNCINFSLQSAAW